MEKGIPPLSPTLILERKNTSSAYWSENHYWRYNTERKGVFHTSKHVSYLFFGSPLEETDTYINTDTKASFKIRNGYENIFTSHFTTYFLISNGIEKEISAEEGLALIKEWNIQLGKQVVD
ncbi:hypothetical protein V6R21_26315 [Limibacter armeniacum]|uniref:hypothetical protein n=1 Tax=Limibacter armeniacum TaxID=466084 RepID=UPI002FE635A1